MAYDLAALQALVDLGDPVEIASTETYTLDGPLLVDAGTQINLNGRIVRAFAGSSGATNALIRNRAFGSVNGFRLYGRGTLTTADGAGGKMVAVLGNNMVMNGVRVDGYSGGQAFTLAGDNIDVRSVIVRNSAAATGTGGIRIHGGVGVDVADCIVDSGDDAIQVVPSNSPVDPFFGIAASNVRFRRCTGSSSVARFIAVFLDSATTTNVSDVAFYDCHGTGANRVVYIENIGAGALSNVLLRRCDLAVPDEPFFVQNQEILLSNSNDVTLRGVSLTNPTSEWFEVNDNCSNVLIEHSTFGTHRISPGENGCTIWTATGTTVRHNTFVGGGALRGVFIKSGATGTVVVNNNISAVTSTTAIVDQGVGSTVSGNA